MVKIKLFHLLIIIIFISSSTNAGICGSITSLKNILCHILKYYFPIAVPQATVALHFIDKAVPQASVALHFIDKLYDAQSTTWDNVRKDVEKYVEESLDSLKWRNIDSWQKSMIARVKTCSVKTDKDDSSCLRNLHEDLAGFEPQFRGYTRKEMALFLKYYDIFVITYLSVSDQLQDLADENLTVSTRGDIAMKAKMFINYFKQAIPQAKFYACRHIKIAIERHNGFWWSFQYYWPKDFEKINIPKELDPSFYSDRINTANVNDDSLYHRGCGLLKKSVRFRSYIYNTKDSSTLKGGPFCKDLLIRRSHMGYLLC